MISFPTSPTSGQTYTEGGTTWEFNGAVWNVIAESTGEQTVDNIRIGVTTDNTIDTSTGILYLGSDATNSQKVEFLGEIETAGNITLNGDIQVNGSIDFLGGLTQNGAAMAIPDSRITRTEDGTDVIFTFN